ncbi:unnamed protein product [Discosporangium mesarthrocarpum]
MEADEGVVFEASKPTKGHGRQVSGVQEDHVGGEAEGLAAVAAAREMEGDNGSGAEAGLSPRSRAKRKRTEAAGGVRAGGGQDRPNFPALGARAMQGGKDDNRRIRCPAHRMTPLRNNWELIVTPTVEHMKLQIRFNKKTRTVELKSSQHTQDGSALQKTADFIEAFMMGFEVQDAVALLRLDDLYVDSFEVHDVKTLSGDHLSRAIGRIAGQGGKTRHAVENATKTRVVVADQRIHILGSFSNIKVARNAICSLILGAPPGKVYNQMRNVSQRMNEKF